MSRYSVASLIDAFCQSADRYPERTALEVAGQSFTYADLEARAAALASALLRAEGAAGGEAQPVVAFLGYRSLGAYVSVLGVLAAGKGYVPLNPNFPLARTRTMLALSRCATLVASPEAAEVLHGVLADAPRPLTVICLEGLDAGTLRAAYPRHRFATPCDGDSAAAPTRIDRDAVARVSPDGTAYLLFTSGSTGVPKGVPVSHGNAASYVSYVVPRYGFAPTDRFSQAFDMTFDLSVHDMFVCWASGAALVSVPHAAVMAPAKLIRDARLTVWFSVPSVIMFMQRLRTLRPASLPDLRISLFCGEPLLERWADAWQQAAPNSIVENVYGPTEATIAISHYRWDPVRERNRCANGVVPIGTIFATQTGMIVGADGAAATRGQPGELWLSGSQVTRGYLDNPEKTAQQFVSRASDPRVWYRTGDMVVEDEDGVMQYLGRVDNQVQVNGYRVELQEIDEVLRHASGNDSAMAVAWPLEAGRADSVYAFLCAPPATDTAAIIRQCESVLPGYMVPKAIFLIGDMPLNANGKIDRAALARSVGELISAKS
jgi:amino acid adenylation domain-containing protein